jgi:hypothetical protein
MQYFKASRLKLLYILLFSNNINYYSMQVNSSFDRSFYEQDDDQQERVGKCRSPAERSMC